MSARIFPVPSTMTARMREGLYPWGAKDDPRDADLTLDIFGQHRDKPMLEELRKVPPGELRTFVCTTAIED